MLLYQLFVQILNMGITASVVIMAVLLLRILMYRLPKKYIYMLWLIVGIRLVCPFAVSSPISVFNLTGQQAGNTFVKLDSIPVLKQETGKISSTKNINSKIQNNQLMDKTSSFRQHGTVTRDTSASNNNIQPGMDTPSGISLFIKAGTTVWITGIIAILLWNLLLMVSTKKRLYKAVLYCQNIYECDNISSPFVMGLIRPHIYIPFRLDANEQEYILKHEMYHIHRKDYIVKFVAFLILTVYWFHPLVWISYLCMVRDMEMSCDEYVLETMKTDIRADYSKSLLGFATNRRILSAGLLSFGETDTRRRVKNIMKFKKQKKWIAVTAVIIIFATGATCLTNADKKTDKIQDKKIQNEENKNKESKNINYDATIAEETINGYDLKLVLLPDEDSKTNSKKTLPEDSSLYEGIFALVSYKDGDLYDEYKLQFQHNDKMYFPKDGITLHIKDYDGDGNADDFSLGQGQTPIPELGNFMVYQFFTVDEDGSIVKFSTSWNSGVSITTIPDEFSKEFKRSKYGVVFTRLDTEDGTAKKDYTNIVRLVSIKDTSINHDQQTLWQAAVNTMPRKVIDELDHNGVWHLYADSNILSLANAGSYDDVTLRLDFSYKDNKLIYYVSKEYGFVDSLPEERINKKQALALAQKFAKEFCGKELTAVKGKKEARKYNTNTIWQEKTPLRYDKNYAYFKDSYGAAYVVQLNHNIVISYNEEY